MKNTIIGILLAIFMAGCGGGGGSKSVFDDSSCVGSPQGSVGMDKAIFSPDGKFYAKQNGTWGDGALGVFDGSTGLLVAQIQALPAGTSWNDVKSMAWSRNSKFVAIMYHGGMRPGINLYDAGNGAWVREIERPISYYRYIVFSQDNSQILVSYNGKDVDQRFATGL